MSVRKYWVCLSLVALAATSAFAASGDEFYDRLFNRGVSQFNEGNYANAYNSLRTAAFGLLEDVRRFETAEVYMTLSASRLRRESDARAAAQRVIAAERIERRYGSLSLPDAIRKEFDEAARTLLTADQVAFLHGGAPATSTRPPAPQTTTITVPPPIIVPAPQPKQTAPRVDPPAPQPKAAQPQPQPQPARPQPQPQVVQPQPVAPQPVAPVPQPVRPSAEPSLAEAERAVNSGDLATARTLYRAVIDAPQISHANALRAAEGLYRARDFAGAIRAFQRGGTIGAGEEQYHYYYAVALYENGRYAEAKRELQAALPFIEVTPDVQRYRVKIEGAIE
jgi:hypothetical protein